MNLNLKNINWRKVVFIIGILFIFCFLIFVIVRPFDNMIVEDKPILNVLCEMQARCVIGSPAIKCGYSINTPQHYRSNVSKSVAKHSWYKGCNESTSGFFVTEGGLKFVQGLHICSCGGLQ